MESALQRSRLLSEEKYGSRALDPGGRQLDRISSKATEAEDDGERNYEELGARLERMKGVVQNLQAEVVNLTNKMGGFMNLPASDSSKDKLARISSTKITSSTIEAEKGKENTSFVQPGTIDSPSTGVQDTPQCITPIHDSPRRSEGLIGRHVHTHTPSPEPRNSIESSDAESPHRPGTPVRTPVGSPMCRSLPRSTGSPDALSCDDFDGRHTFEESQGSDSDESEGNPWGHPPAKFVELVRQLQLGNLPENVLRTYDTTLPNPRASMPPRTEPVPPKPWEGKVKLGIEAAGFSSSSKSTIPMRKDSPIPQTGFYSRTRIVSRSSSRSRSVAGDKERKANKHGSQDKASGMAPTPAGAFVFGSDGI